MSTVYSDPEKFGLALVAEVDRAGGYSFSKFVVWHNRQTGRLVYGTDAGCSCPRPFEDTKVGDLKDFERLAAFEAWLAESREQPDLSQVTAFKAAVRKRLAAIRKGARTA